MEENTSPNSRTIALDALPIELSALLKFVGLAESGGEAKHFIKQGLVTVNGEVETRKGRKLYSGDRVKFGDETLVVQEA